MEDGDKLYVQCTLGAGEHNLELYAYAEENALDNPKWTFAVDGSEEQALTLEATSNWCPVEITYPKTNSCAVNTVLMPTKPIYSEGYLEQGKMIVWAMKMRDGQKVVSETNGSSDIDLYLRWNDCPTTSKWNRRGYTTKGYENEYYVAPEDGYLYIGVRGYKASDFTLHTTCDGVDKMCSDLWTREEAAEWSPGRTNK